MSENGPYGALLAGVEGRGALAEFRTSCGRRANISTCGSLRWGRVHVQKGLVCISQPGTGFCLQPVSSCVLELPWSEEPVP